MFILFQPLKARLQTYTKCISLQLGGGGYITPSICGFGWVAVLELMRLQFPHCSKMLSLPNRCLVTSVSTCPPARVRAEPSFFTTPKIAKYCIVVNVRKSKCVHYLKLYMLLGECVKNSPPSTRVSSDGGLNMLKNFMVPMLVCKLSL